MPTEKNSSTYDNIISVGLTNSDISDSKKLIAVKTKLIAPIITCDERVINAEVLRISALYGLIE